MTTDIDPDARYRPRANYGAPRLHCDLVMKGGITSGVVYPLAICKLAETYRLHSIGGASAGAIGAAAAAAAEYARRSGRLDGYTKLEALPGQLGAATPSGRTRLMSLFQAGPKTRKVFDLLLALIAKSGRWHKVTRVVARMLFKHWPVPVLALAIIGALFSQWPGSVGQGIAFAIASVVVLMLGIAGGAVFAAKAAYDGIANNYGGICRGHNPDHPDGEPALCEWLADLIDDVAGKTDGAPLTFGELRNRQDPDLDIELAMMTTNLTHGRPYRLPFADQVTFWFDKQEMRDLFPTRVAEHLERMGRARLESASDEVRRIFEDNGGATGRYLPLPIGDHLPLVVGARMSLSFPVLLSAIPLYAVDWTSVRHPELEELAEHDALSSQSWRPQAKLPDPGKFVLRRCWFSDGGICSNLPIHFFDALLPRKPTFTLNLRAASPNFPFWQPGVPGSELDNVYVPENPNAEFAESWQNVGADAGPLGPVQLIAAMIDTMQNWNDNMLVKAPGYRDRVVHISHTEDEGGMNLDMPHERITRLSLRGAAAGHKIGTRFDEGGGWNNHLWVRYRSALGMLQGLLTTAHERYFASEDGRSVIARLLQQQPYWRLSPEEAAAAAAANDAFQQFNGFSSTVDFAKCAPRPISDLRPRPR